MESSMKINEAYEVEWLDIEVADSLTDDLRFRGYAAGACLFARGEGNFCFNGEIYFTCNAVRKKVINTLE